MEQVAEDLEVGIMHTNERVLEECVAAIYKQTLQPSRVYFVANVTPLSKALSQYFSRMSAPFNIKVDADVILHPYAIERLYNEFKQVDKGKYYTMVGFVEDVLVGRTSGLRIYKVNDKIRKLQVPNRIGCDRHETRYMRENYKLGIAHYSGEEALGIHRCDWDGVRSIVSTFFNTGQKCFALNDRKMKQFHTLCKQFVETGDLYPLAAIVAWSHGLFIERKTEKSGGYGDKIARHILRLMSEKHLVLTKVNVEKRNENSTG